MVKRATRLFAGLPATEEIEFGAVFFRMDLADTCAWGGDLGVVSSWPAGRWVSCVWASALGGEREGGEEVMRPRLGMLRLYGGAIVRKQSGIMRKLS